MIDAWYKLLRQIESFHFYWKGELINVEEFCMAELINLDDGGFDETVLSSDKPVLVGFWIT